MERFRNYPNELLPVYLPGVYRADSIADTLRSSERVIDEIRSEHDAWFKRKSIVEKFNFYGISIAALLTSVDFTYLIFDKAIPRIEWAPRTLIVLPDVRHFPAKDDGLKTNMVKIYDQTGSLDVEFPSGIATYYSHFGGSDIDEVTAKETAWRSKVVLYYVHEPVRRPFLVHIQEPNVPVKERVKVKTPVSNFSPSFIT